MKKNEGKKAIVAAAIGNALESYDFALYGFLAPTLQAVFFPNQSLIKGLLSTFLVFAIGLFMRPLGGLFFAFIGDRIGRKRALVLSVSIMAIPMLVIGFLPSYAQAGLYAVAFLIAARLLQGFAVGGEMMGSMVFLVEHASATKRGLSGSYIYSVGTIGGLLGALGGVLLHYFFSEEAVVAWAWRIPFFFGILIGGIGLYIRLKIRETPAFEKLQKENKITRYPFKEAITRHGKEILNIFLLISFQAVGFYLPFVYLSTWLLREAHFSSFAALSINSLGLLLLILFIPFFAALSDRIGRKKIMMAGCLCTCLIAYPVFKLLSTVEHSSSPYVIATTAMVLFAIVTALFQGPLAALLAESVSTKNRYMSLVIGYNPSAALFGGITPYFSTYLVEITGASTAPSFLLIATGAIAFLVLFFWVKETYNLPLK